MGVNKPTFEQLIQGMKTRQNRNGFMAVELHYSADPSKATEEWLKKTRPGYSEPGWKREMEIDFGALGGTLAFRHYFTQWEGKIVVRPLDEVPLSWPKYGTMDYGTQSPTAFLVYTINPENQIIVIWEYYSPGPLHQHAQAIIDNPYYGEFAWITIDPRCRDKTQNVEGNLRSISELLEDQYGVFTIPGNNNRSAGRDRIEWHWRDLDNREPTLLIAEDCTNLITELKNIRYEEWSSVLRQKRAPKEDTVKVKDHAYDALRYGLLSQPSLDANEMTRQFANEKRARKISHANAMAQPTFGDGDEVLGQFYK